MRDIIIFGIVVAGCLMALGRPWIGVIMWTWVSVMNPHTQGWGWIQTMPVAMMVALCTFAGFLFTRDKRSPFSDPAVLCLVLFVVWVVIGWPFSFYPGDSREMLVRVLKIDLMVLVTIALLTTRQQIQWFVGVMTFSIGFYGVKGGMFTLATGGGHKVWGPGGFIGGNNEIALAIILVMPFIYYGYLAIDPTRAWLRRGMLAAMGLSAAAALGSHSRGALLAIVAMTLFLWWRSEKKLGLGVVLAVLGVSLIAFMPSNWNERMQTIETYEKDSSAMGRINAWKMATNLANDRVIAGGGFSIYEPSTFARYAPDATDIHAAHSVYFQVLGEHGWLGLALWIAIWWYTWRGAAWIRANATEAAGTKWCSHLASMCQVSLVGYAVGGAFLSLAYFDLPYNVMITVVVTRRWMQERGQHNVSVPMNNIADGVAA